MRIIFLVLMLSGCASRNVVGVSVDVDLDQEYSRGELVVVCVATVGTDKKQLLSGVKGINLRLGQQLNSRFEIDLKDKTNEAN